MTNTTQLNNNNKLMFTSLVNYITSTQKEVDMYFIRDVRLKYRCNQSIDPKYVRDGIPTRPFTSTQLSCEKEFADYPISDAHQYFSNNQTVTDDIMVISNYGTMVMARW